jgi:hypothetical protein
MRKPRQPARKFRETQAQIQKDCQKLSPEEWRQAGQVPGRHESAEDALNDKRKSLEKRLVDGKDKITKALEPIVQKIIDDRKLTLRHRSRHGGFPRSELRYHVGSTQGIGRQIGESVESRRQREGSGLPGRISGGYIADMPGVIESSSVVGEQPRHSISSGR